RDAAGDGSRPGGAVVGPRGAAVGRAVERHRAEGARGAAGRRDAVRVAEEGVRVRDDVLRVVRVDGDVVLALISVGAAVRIDVGANRRRERAEIEFGNAVLAEGK